MKHNNVNTKKNRPHTETETRLQHGSKNGRTERQRKENTCGSHMSGIFGVTSVMSSFYAYVEIAVISEMGFTIISVFILCALRKASTSDLFVSDHSHSKWLFLTCQELVFLLPSSTFFLPTF